MLTTLNHLGTVWRAWGQVAQDLDDGQWSAPTRLPGWRVVDVYAHHAYFPVALLGLCAAGSPDAPVSHRTAAALLATFNAPGGPAHVMANLVRDHAVSQAGALNQAELISRFTETGPEALERCAAQDPARLIDYAGQAVMPFGQAVRIGLMEATVHYLDVARALGLAVPGPTEGGPLRETAALLTEVADPLTFVEVVTGRSEVDLLPLIH